MIVYWVAAVEVLFYLSAVPLRMAFYLRSENGLQFGAGVGVFERRFAQRSALARLTGEKPMPAPKKFSWEKLPAIAKLSLQFLRNIHIDQFSLYGRFSLGDAASTALVCGGVNALECALHAVWPKIRMNLQPDFNTSNVHIELQGMIYVRIGQIMFAATISALNYANGRITQWIDTRLKAS